jgi:cytochrome c oxidase subunit 4
MKAFFEDPALLVGFPLLAVGAVGAIIALATLATPQPAMAGAPAAPRRHGVHPGPAEYIQIGAILALLTAIEVSIYYVDIQQGIFVTILLALSASKFAFVVMWFMHLRFDNRIFSTLFVGGFVLAASVFIVVLATLGGNLV